MFFMLWSCLFRLCKVPHHHREHNDRCNHVSRGLGKPRRQAEQEACVLVQDEVSLYRAGESLLFLCRAISAKCLFSTLVRILIFCVLCYIIIMYIFTHFERKRT